MREDDGQDTRYEEWLHDESLTRVESDLKNRGIDFNSLNGHEFELLLKFHETEVVEYNDPVNNRPY